MHTFMQTDTTYIHTNNRKTKHTYTYAYIIWRTHKYIHTWICTCITVYMHVSHLIQIHLIPIKLIHIFFHRVSQVFWKQFFNQLFVRLIITSASVWVSIKQCDRTQAHTCHRERTSMRKYAQSGIAGKYRRSTSDRAHLLVEWTWDVLCATIARMVRGT